MMEQMDGVVLTLADLVVVSDTMEPYALTFPSRPTLWWL